MFRCTRVLATLAGATVVSVAVPIAAQEPALRTIDINYSPRIAPDASSYALLNQPVVLRLTDGRSGDRTLVGTETKVDGSIVGLRASKKVPPLVIRAMQSAAAEFDVVEDRDSNLVLEGRLLVFNGMVQERGDGALYIAHVRLAFDLRTQTGDLLWTDVASGDTSEFGPRFKIGPLNRALSNALVDAFEDLFGDTTLRAAWTGTAEHLHEPHPSELVVPGDVSQRLQAMKKEGLAIDSRIARIRDNWILVAPPDVYEIAGWKSAGVQDRVIRAVLDRPVAAH